MMKAFLSALLSVLMLAGTLAPQAVAAADPRKLSQAEVKQFVQTMDQHISQRRTEQILAMLSPDVSIQLFVEGKGKTNELNFSGYKRMLEAGFRNIKSYQYMSRINSIELQGNNRAKVTTTAMEQANYQDGKTLSGVSTVVYVLEKQNGKVLLKHKATNVAINE